MPNLKEVRNNILLAYSADLIDEEECVLLYDINRSKTPGSSVLGIPYV